MYVCEDCVEIEELQAVVRENAISDECDYCNKSSGGPIACELEDIVKRIRYSIYQEYGSPEEETMYDSEEGEYFGTVLDNTELFEEIGFDLDNSELHDAIVSRFLEHQFCRKGMLSGSISERQMDAWHGFKEIIKHERRYTFWAMEDADHGIIEHPPSKMIQNIAQTINEFDLIKKLDIGTCFWRVRVHDKSEVFNKASDLASPNCDQAIYSNRMSPAGVSMFYGADEFDTAIRETVDSEKTENKNLTGCIFHNVKPLFILDLLDIPTYSFFSKINEFDRQSLDFLNDFQNDISQPIRKENTQHIEYVPTQVLTEYLRYELKLENNVQLNGIRFRSSKDNKGCYILFCDQESCLSESTYRRKEQLLDFDPSSLKTVNVASWISDNPD